MDTPAPSLEPGGAMKRPGIEKATGMPGPGRGRGRPFGKDNPPKGRPKGVPNKRTKAFDDLVSLIEVPPPEGLGLEVAKMLAAAMLEDPPTLRWYLEMRFGKPRGTVDVAGITEAVKIFIGTDPREDV